VDLRDATESAAATVAAADPMSRAGSRSGPAVRVESLLCARLFLRPQRVGDRLYFISDLGGRLSLYAMDARPGGSVPEPLLPPHLALQNPHLLTGFAFRVFPKLGKILAMLDRDGDENYQPMLVPLTGGFPEPAFPSAPDMRYHAFEADTERNVVHLVGEAPTESLCVTFRGDLNEGTLRELTRNRWMRIPIAVSPDHDRVALIEGYTAGDTVLYLWSQTDCRAIVGTPIEQRGPGHAPERTGFSYGAFTRDGALLLLTSLFSDTYGLGLLEPRSSSEVKPVRITGTAHAGNGELTQVEPLGEGATDRYRLTYNVDGVSWVYEARLDEGAREMRVEHVLCGSGPLADGVLDYADYDAASDSHVLAHSSATSPTRLVAVGGRDRGELTAYTRERVLGIAPEWMAGGEDASFTSHDGLRVSARLYRPAAELGFQGPRPLVYYIHGGPQSQERPDFAWFSMPLIQYLTMNGFSVFVPNARGSSGYGLDYMKRVDRDWGGQDRLDHVHAMTQVLRRDPAIDVDRAGVVGRSYGGYMTLMLAARHPELWKGAVDMFGPYDLITFTDRIPPTWKPYFIVEVGDPAIEADRADMRARSPSTYIDRIACPLLVIQGRNDPRVVERESHDVVERLRAAGKDVEYLVFENEGHDVLKLDNKARCYETITDFFRKRLG
jgi:pimeloyl-ACP methyl ester carboxylesterase